MVSGMSIEVSDLPSGTEMRFNGTVEWALDSIAQDEVIWLPREDQMRDALGERFLRLEGDRCTGGYAVVLTGEERHVDIDAERAYARALLSVLPGPRPDRSGRARLVRSSSRSCRRSASRRVSAAPRRAGSGR